MLILKESGYNKGMRKTQALIFFMFLFLSSLALSGCSLYQSESRKFLEREAFEFAADPDSLTQWSFEALQIEEPCAELSEKPKLKKSEWSLLEASKKESYWLYQAETKESVDILLYKTGRDGRHFLCSYYYDSLHDRIEKLENDLYMAYQTIQHLESI